MKIKALEAMISTIHPDDYPEDARHLLAALRTVNLVPRDKLIAILKKHLFRELRDTTAFSEGEIAQALGYPLPDAPGGSQTRSAPVMAAPLATVTQLPVPAPKRPSKRGPYRKLCSVRGCGAVRLAKMLCQRHYGAFRRLNKAMEDVSPA